MEIFRTRRQYPAAPPEFKNDPLWGIFYDRWQENIPHVENKKIIKIVFKNMLT
jgi:hypothetical protein